MKKKNLKSKFSRIIPIILITLLILIAIFALVTIGKAIFKKGGGNQKDTQIAEAQLLKTDANHAVRMIVRGPIVANENFRSYQVVIKPNQRQFGIYKGYLDHYVTGEKLGNNTKAYEEFVYALDKANLDAGKPFSGAKDDIRGICAGGTVTEFDILKDGESVKHLWTSTCKGSVGSLRANVRQVKGLFLRQIPNIDQILYKNKVSF